MAATEVQAAGFKMASACRRQARQGMPLDGGDGGRRAIVSPADGRLASNGGDGGKGFPGETKIVEVANLSVGDRFEHNWNRWRWRWRRQRLQDRRRRCRRSQWIRAFRSRVCGRQGRRIMLPGRAEAGHAGSLDTRPPTMDLNSFGVQGNGCLRIDESCHPPRMIWGPNRRVEFNFHSKDHDMVEETQRALEAFHAEAIALAGENNPALDATDLEEPCTLPDAAPNDEAHHRRSKFDAYISRMKLLQDEAVHDGYVLNLSSEVDFRHFVRSAPNIRKGNLVLMDNGNLRAIWKDKQGTRLGLQFLGGRMVQYVIFKRRKKQQPISRVTGRDSIEGFERQIHAFELHSLLYG